MELTAEEQKEAEMYNGLSQEEKNKYLEENGVIILDIKEEEDGSATYAMEIKDEYYRHLQSSCKEGETISDVFIRTIKEYIKKHDNENS